MVRSVFIILSWVVFVLGTEAQTLPSVHFHQSKIFVTKGDWWPSATIINNKWLTIYTEDAFMKNLQPMAGTCRWQNDSLVFIPLFEFAPGAQYHAIFDYNLFLDDAKISHLVYSRIEYSFRVPEISTTPTIVEAVYPKSQSLPENLLRFYIQFSQAIAPGEIFQHIHLYTSAGRKVENAFLIIDQELWSDDRKRFTLLFDPGRIKRGIRSNLELGLPLQAGNRYTLLIDSLLRDVHGQTLAASFKKEFVVAEAWRTRLNPKNWKVTSPKFVSAAMQIKFDRPVDFVLATKCMEVVTADGNRIPGDISLENDTLLSFTPHHHWKPGLYHLRVSPTLEDVAGNNLNNPFDLDTRQQPRVSSMEWVKIEFRVTDK